MNERAEFIKSQIFDLIKQYHHEVYHPKAFVLEESTVLVSG